MSNLNIREFDDDLHREANWLAKWNGESLKALVTRAVQVEVERLKREQARSR